MKRYRKYIMDYETIINCFIASFMNEYENIKTFVVHDKRNDIKELIEFLEKNISNKDYHISYNGLAFDAQITNYIINNKKSFLSNDSDYITKEIYNFAQLIIELSSNNEFLPYAPFELYIRQVDLYTLNHWNNPAKRSSLKWIAYSLDTENLMEMPYPHDVELKTSQLDAVIEYCENDVKETCKIYKISIPQINLRYNLTKLYKINLLSASEASISKKLFVQSLSEELKIPEKKLNKMRTYRNNIKVSDIIFDYISFETPEFQSILDKFREVNIDPKNTKGAIEFNFEFKNCHTKFALGGLHGANESGVYKSDDSYVIITADVASYYPNLAIENSLSPGHINNIIFNKKYKWFYTERKKYPKSNPLNYTYKIILNSTYGLSNEVNSPFYDPLFTMSITINGQLLLFKLYEMIMMKIPDAIPLMQNTDGLEFKIPRNKINEYYEVCKEWEKLTRLTLEFDVYEKMFISDVNSYLAVFSKKEITQEEYKKLQNEKPFDIYTQEKDKFYVQKVKQKGRLQFLDLELHKNKSYLAIRKAVYMFFIFGDLPEDTILGNKNIFDFCAGHKSKGDFRIFEYKITNGKFEKKPLQKIIRYYVAKSGCKLIKEDSSGKKIKLESGPFHERLYLKHENKDWDDYNIEYKYYIMRAYDEINRIIVNNKQKTLQLF